jgi:MinD superfamily P-loop ATPase
MTSREVREVLKSMGAHPECPSCHRCSWSARPEAVVRTKDDPDDITAHVFLCTSCGFMRLHAVEVPSS